MRKWLSKHRRPLLAFGIPLFGVLFLTYVGENYFPSCAKAWFETCVQFFSGNWPPPNGALRTSLVFAGGVTLRCALLYGGAFALVRIWKDLALEKEALVMRYSELLRDRDLTIKNAVMSILPMIEGRQNQEAIAKAIDVAFETGERDFLKQHLPFLAGSDEAASRIVEALEKPIVSQQAK